MTEPQITFVVPAYNAQATINRTIESILRQTDDRYKIIIVNDGSTDDTEKICMSYEKQYPQKITYIYQENRGLGGARNKGMQLTKTQFVSFLDSDDWIVPEYVENIIFQLEKKGNDFPEIIMILPQIYNENSKIVSSWYDKELFEEIFISDGQIVNPQIDTRLFWTDVNQCRKLLNMDFVNRVHFQFREQIKWEDVCPHFYLLTQCQSCMGIGSVGFYYRKGNSSQITALRGKDRLDLIIVYQDLLKLLKNTHISKAADNQLKAAAVQLMISFAREGIRMADTDTRKELVLELNQIFKKIPKKWFRKAQKNNKDAVRYQLFQMVVKHKLLNRWFYDYLYQYASETFIKKIIKTFRRKEKIHGTA